MELLADLNRDFDNEDIQKNREIVDKFLKKCNTGEFYISDIKCTNSTRNPPRPFTTSTLQQEASNKLSMSPKETMSIAQKLYENGKITYMRTDSENLSEDAKKSGKEKILKEFGNSYYQEYKSKKEKEKRQKQ